MTGAAVETARVRSFPRTAETDRFFDYCLQPYDPLRGNECRAEFFNHVLKDVGIALLADIIIHVFVIASSHNEPEAFSDLARGLAKRNTVDQALFEGVGICSPLVL